MYSLAVQADSGAFDYNQRTVMNSEFLALLTWIDGVVAESEFETDYVVSKKDGEKCWLRIDIPAMRLDNTAQKGDAIQVRIRLIWDKELDRICPGCVPPAYCECIRTVGYVGCGSENVGGNCLFFPYLVQGEEDGGGWVSGVGISASGERLPDDAWCELVLRDPKGNIAVWKKQNMGGIPVWSFILDRIMDNFDRTVVPGPVSLEVRSNFPMGGYGFLMNRQWQIGAGQMPVMCQD